MPESTKPTEFIFLGTGTSSSVPHVDCLTSPPDGRRCDTCLSTLHPEGVRNIRRNTNAVIRTTSPRDGADVTIVIDAGKTFQQAATQWFPKYGLRTITALLLTHPHADAMNGLDDCRSFTLGGRIQAHIDIYCNAYTFTEVQRCFPYLVAKEYASGGGDVPEFKWHIIEDKVPFEIGDTGIMVTPFEVHHGRVFTVPPCPSIIGTPITIPSTPTTQPTPTSIKVGLDGLQTKAILTTEKEVIVPYYCLGFKISDSIVYISDTSFIPEDAWKIILPKEGEKLPLFVLDLLSIKGHISHFGIAQAVETIRRMRARRTYLLGFSHEVTHSEWTRMFEVISAGKSLSSTGKGWLDNITPRELEGIERAMHNHQGNDTHWARPAFDGLRVWVSANRVWDEGYEAPSAAGE
ncbi:hypothetical protein CYLTODRAFT_455891 [Cylindrobasidium torrendii FP15055 ss-10]|uniref:Metallo-beta-lactamase domain-containing protein n=1 Tax=Cylindrobasidium torrendii FP15055 ss-10 TaxID=1314674 RepID=A0A0D7B6S9_9AGAR|nr:hypothetical protein CYLTODRAFT_455891 [Cylindrobasidium torrendii FP15055 ss-10]